MDGKEGAACGSSPLARLPGAFVLLPGGTSTCPVRAHGTPAKDVVFFPGGLMAEALSSLEHHAHFLSSPFPGALLETVEASIQTDATKWGSTVLTRNPQLPRLQG